VSAVVIAAMAALFILVGSAMANRKRPPGHPPARFRPGLDRQRSATPQQRRVLYRRQRGLCALCSLPLAGRKAECHHVVPWSRGGRTVLSNLALVHAVPCHEKLTARQAALYHWQRVRVRS